MNGPPGTQHKIDSGGFLCLLAGFHSHYCRSLRNVQLVFYASQSPHGAVPRSLDGIQHIKHPHALAPHGLSTIQRLRPRPCRHSALRLAMDCRPTQCPYALDERSLSLRSHRPGSAGTSVLYRPRQPRNSHQLRQRIRRPTNRHSGSQNLRFPAQLPDIDTGLTSSDRRQASPVATVAGHPTAGYLPHDRHKTGHPPAQTLRMFHHLSGP